MYLVIYVSSIIRSVTALHDLLQNKIRFDEVRQMRSRIACPHAPKHMDARCRVVAFILSVVLHAFRAACGIQTWVEQLCNACVHSTRQAMTAQLDGGGGGGGGAAAGDGKADAKVRFFLDTRSMSTQQ